MAVSYPQSGSKPTVNLIGLDMYLRDVINLDLYVFNSIKLPLLYRGNNGNGNVQNMSTYHLYKCKYSISEMLNQT